MYQFHLACLNLKVTLKCCSTLKILQNGNVIFGPFIHIPKYQNIGAIKVRVGNAGKSATTLMLDLAVKLFKREPYYDFIQLQIRALNL